MKLNEEKKKQIRESYEAGQFTRLELALANKVTTRTIDRVLKGVKKSFKYDASNVAISLDKLKEGGHEIPDYSMEPSRLLTPEVEYVKIVKCPSCAYHTTANKLLYHLIRKHHRHDLEYLIRNDVW